MKRHSTYALIWVLFISAFTCSAQSPVGVSKTQAVDDEIERVDVTLVNVLAVVKDRPGRFVTNLRREDFRLYEDGVEQQITHFAAAQAPFTVILLLDTSGSARFRLKDIQDAAMSFVELLRPEDRVAVVAFSDEVEVLAEPTSDRAALREAIWRAGAGDGTHLYDAVDFTIRQRLDRMPGRKALVLFTDGVDNVSRLAGLDNTIREAHSLDGLIYTVQYDTFLEGVSAVVAGGSVPGLDNPSVISTKSSRVYPRGFSEKDYARARDYLEKLASATGARYYHADDLPKIREAFAQVAEELRSQYSLGYYPKHPPGDGRAHEIKVRLNNPGLLVRARSSYISRPTM
jgi:VWFA-related protein